MSQSNATEILTGALLQLELELERARGVPPWGAAVLATSACALTIALIQTLIVLLVIPLNCICKMREERQQLLPESRPEEAAGDVPEEPATVRKKSEDDRFNMEV